MPKISVIVPVYNVEKYLDRCIKSILAQTFSDFELILVDDGSPDKCPEMCDSWKAKDDRIRVVHKENGGLASARNAGLDIFAGEYVFFIDSDDYLSEDCLEHFENCVLDGEDAYIFGGFVNVFVRNDSIDTIPQKFFEQKAEKSRHDFLKLKNNNITGYACNVLFCSRIIKENKLRFSTEVIVEDLPFVLDYVKHTSKLVYTGYCDYFYFHDERQTLSVKYYKYGFLRWQEKYAVTVRYINDHIPEKMKEQELIDTANVYLYHFLCSLNNTFDSRNTDSTRLKMKYNSSVVKSDEFKHCLKFYNAGNEDKRYLFLLKYTNYYIAHFYRFIIRTKKNIMKK